MSHALKLSDICHQFNPVFGSLVFAAWARWVPPQLRTYFKWPQRRLPAGCWQTNKSSNAVLDGLLDGAHNTDQINAIVGSDVLVLKILSFLTPKHVNKAFHEASSLFLVSHQFKRLFLRCLQSLPLHLFYGGEEPNDDLVAWAKQSELKIGHLEADVSVVYIVYMIEGMTGLDLGSLTRLMLSVTRRNLSFRTADLHALYAVFVQQNGCTFMILADTTPAEFFLPYTRISRRYI